LIINRKAKREKKQLDYEKLDLLHNFCTNGKKENNTRILTPYQKIVPKILAQRDPYKNSNLHMHLSYINLARKKEYYEDLSLQQNDLKIECTKTQKPLCTT